METCSLNNNVMGVCVCVAYAVNSLGPLDSGSVQGIYQENILQKQVD